MLSWKRMFVIVAYVVGITSCNSAIKNQEQGHLSFARDTLDETNWAYNIMVENDAGEFIRFPHSEEIRDFSWSLDGQKIAFASSEREYPSRDIIVMNLDGSEKVNLTSSLEYSEHPAWSPDGKYIAFTSRLNQSSDIYIVKSDSSGLRKLTNTNCGDGHPTWSPDGKQLAFVLGCKVGSKNELDIYKIDIDGSNLVQLTATGFNFEPAWSPDGTKIAFVSYRDKNFEIYVMNLDGSDQMNITNNLGNDRDPDWSLDGKKLSFWSIREGNAETLYVLRGFNSEIFVMNADGSELIKITDNGVFDLYPQWKP